MVNAAFSHREDPADTILLLIYEYDSQSLCCFTSLLHFHDLFWLSHILVYLFYFCPIASVLVGTEV